MSGQEHCIVFNIEKIILWYLICIVFEGKKLSYLILIAGLHNSRLEICASLLGFFLFRLFF